MRTSTASPGWPTRTAGVSIDKVITKDRCPHGSTYPSRSRGSTLQWTDREQPGGGRVQARRTGGAGGQRPADTEPVAARQLAGGQERVGDHIGAGAERVRAVPALVH